MRGVSKKMFISILTSVIVFVTMVATTFAWVGIFTYANTESFQLNLKVSELNSNYYLTISNSGLRGSFSDEVSSIDMKRQIVDNIYGDRYKNLSDSGIEQIFSEIILAPTTTSIVNNKFNDFEKIDFRSSRLKFIKCNDYYKFDLYFSVDTKEGITSETTGIKTNIFLTNLTETLVGTKATDSFYDCNPFGELPSSQVNDILMSIPDKFSVDSKNACRIGFELYEPINIDDDYSGNEEPIKSMIYQGGNELPLYDSFNDTYDLGGCLPEDQNTALQELKKIRPDYTNNANRELYYSRLDIALNRNDLMLVEENSSIWDKTQYSSYLGVMDGIQTKMKVSVYFWFEGWDSDCLRLIVRKPVTMNLTFTSGTEEE